MALDDIHPITALKRDAAALISRARERRSPVVITQNGRATAVLQDSQSFEEDRRAFALLKLAIQGEQDILEGRGMSYTKHRKRMKALLRDLKSQ